MTRTQRTHSTTTSPPQPSIVGPELSPTRRGVEQTSPLDLEQRAEPARGAAGMGTPTGSQPLPIAGAPKRRVTSAGWLVFS
jgi:hypothetical protein